MVNRIEEQGDIPILPSLASTMNVDVAVNEDAQVWVFHDQPLPGHLDWAELDVTEQSLKFITLDGGTIDLGMPVHPPIMMHARKAARIQVVQMRNKKIWDIYSLPLLVSEQVIN